MTNASVVLGNTWVGGEIIYELSLLDSKVQNNSVCIVILLYDQVTYIHMCVCVCVCMYVCMHVCTYVCMYIFMYVCMYVCMYFFIYL